MMKYGGPAGIRTRVVGSEGQQDNSPTPPGHTPALINTTIKPCLSEVSDDNSYIRPRRFAVHAEGDYESWCRRRAHAGVPLQAHH